MSSRRSVEDWRREVYRARVVVTSAGVKVRVTSTVRLGLIYLSDHMKGDRTVSRPRHLMAADLGVSERSVDNIISAAHVAELLDTVVKGHKGVTAVYQGVFPTTFSANPGVRAKNRVQREETPRPESAPNLRAESPFSANPGVRTTKSNHESPVGCEVCADEGCSNCEGWAS